MLVVISCAVPSEYIPRAVNCCIIPAGMLSLAGVTSMDFRVALVTVRVVYPGIIPAMALIVAGPTERPVAMPLPFTVAIELLDEIQVTWVVISYVVPSEYVPTAENCWVVPAGMLGLAGVTDMDTRVEDDAVSDIPPPPPQAHRPVTNIKTKTNLNPRFICHPNQY